MRVKAIEMASRRAFSKLSVLGFGLHPMDALGTSFLPRALHQYGSATIRHSVGIHMGGR